MSDNASGAAGDLQPKWSISFKTRSSLARTINQPVLVDNPVGLVIFGDTSMIYLAQVADPGAGVYATLGTVKATTYIHGWTVNSGRLYVLDGVELAAWDLRDGVKRESIKLLKEPEAKQAIEALNDLQKAIQRVEWATLLEQSEDEWVRLTAQQEAAAPLSNERDRLDMLAWDYFRMLKGLRETLGSTGGAAAARQLIGGLRRTLAEKRKTAGRWCFSPPVVRPNSFEESLHALFTIQGNGTLFACDKSLKQLTSKKWNDQAEVQLALLPPKSNLELIGYVSNSTLFVVDASTLDEKSHWSPVTAPAAGTSHTLVPVNGRFWWGTEAGVYALQPDENGRLQLKCESGPPWSTRQVGRLNIPAKLYDPPVDPNELFDAMNVRGWIEQRAASAPLNDGITAQLMLSDDAGKYATPPAGTSYILHGPFERDTRSASKTWTQIKPHPNSPMVLLSDSQGLSVLCRYPTAGGVAQLVPQWSVAPWLAAVAPHSAIDVALSQSWPTPSVRQLSKPYPDMAAYFHNSPAGKSLAHFEQILPLITKGRRSLGDRDLRFILWYALFNRQIPLQLIFAGELNDAAKKVLDVFFSAAQLQTLRERFGQPGTVWDYMPGNISTAEHNVYALNFSSKESPVNFDPPWVWKTAPTTLFHSSPPVWYDPWGYNRPGDFVSEQPSPTYLDPFCFNGQLRFPQRPVVLETAFKGRRWALFTDNDPALVLRSAKPPSKSTAGAESVGLRASAEPLALVVTADEDRQRTIFQLLPPKPLRITFDAATHVLSSEPHEFGSIAKHVLASPTVFRNPRATFPAAWCVVNPEFPSVRLRKLATVNPETGASPWDKFVDENKSQYGPRKAGEAWQIEACPLPPGALSTVQLEGYDLPAPV